MKIKKKTYKAISLKQPWANLIAQGKKTIETRKWATNYRGDLVICSSKKPDIRPAGYALCVAELYHIEPMKRKHQKKACIDIYPGAYSWFLRNIRPFNPPVPIEGKLSIFTLKIQNN